MNDQPKTQPVTWAVLAFVLWLVTIGLGLECIFALKEIFYLVFTGLGGSMIKAERFVLGLVFLLGLGFTIFVIGTAEYHRKYVGKPQSWRLFAWSLGVEASIITLYYIL